MSLKVPDEWESLEAAIAEAVRKTVVRGKVHVAVEVTGAAGSTANWDPEAITDTLAADAPPTVLEQMHAAFKTASRFEFLFWDEAWRTEQWPA